MSTEGDPKTSWMNGLHSRMSIGGAVLWLGAGILAVAGHAGALAWALREPPVAMADNAPPPAIMIELAAAPESINTDVNEISDQSENTLEMKSDTVEPVDQPEELVEPPSPEEIPEPEPVDMPEPEIDPVVEQVMADLENIAVPLPMARPEPVAEKKPVEKPKPKKKPTPKKPAPSSKASTQAAAQVRQSTRNAASQKAAGKGTGSVSPAKWQSRLMAHLERRKRYPSGSRARREQGTAYVRFTIDDRGRVLSASLARSSGFADLDKEVVDLVRRASPVPAPPPGVNRTITAPVHFTVR